MKFTLVKIIVPVKYLNFDIRSDFKLKKMSIILN